MVLFCYHIHLYLHLDIGFSSPNPILFVPDEEMEMNINDLYIQRLKNQQKDLAKTGYSQEDCYDYIMH